jgi:hypothetical protein
MCSKHLLHSMICTYVLWSIYTMYHTVNQNKSKGQNDLPRQSYSVTILSTPFLDQAIQQLLSTQTEEDSSCPTKCSVALSIHIDLCINSKPWTRLISSLCRRLQSYPRWCYYNTKISRILRSNSSSKLKFVARKSIMISRSPNSLKKHGGFRGYAWHKRTKIKRFWATLPWAKSKVRLKSCFYCLN